MAGWAPVARWCVATLHRMLTRRHAPHALLLATSLALTACAGDDSDDSPVETQEPDDGADTASSEEPDTDQGDDEADPEDAAPQDQSSDEADPEETAADTDVDPDLSVELSLTEVASMDSAIAGAVGPDGVLYLAERAGTVHPLTDDGIGDAVVDISDETTTDSERGLLGLAFAADGSELYLSSTDLDGDTIVTAVAVEDGEVVGDDRREVYSLEQPESNHNGGDIAVGPDDALYVAIGDGGGGGDPLEAGQDLSTALGTLLRLDPQGGDPYVVPDDNPFVGDDGAVDEIFAYGLRNPWRFSFDRDTDELWIADVGQSDREEVNRVGLDEASGANFGWNLMEGTLEFAGSAPDDHVPPIYEYETGGGEGCAITGGYVYRGEAIPELRGVYLYADYCEGTVRGLLAGEDGEVEQADLGIDGGQVVSFAQDAEGEIYVLDLDGAVHRIDPA